MTGCNVCTATAAREGAASDVWRRERHDGVRPSGHARRDRRERPSRTGWNGCGCTWDVLFVVVVVVGTEGNGTDPGRARPPIGSIARIRGAPARAGTSLASVRTQPGHTGLSCERPAPSGQMAQRPRTGPAMAAGDSGRAVVRRRVVGVLVMIIVVDLLPRRGEHISQRGVWPTGRRRCNEVSRPSDRRPIGTRCVLAPPAPAGSPDGRADSVPACRS